MSTAVHQLALGMQEGLGLLKPSKPDQHLVRLRNRAARDRDFFFSFFLPHMFDLPPSPFHREVDKALAAGTRINRKAPRDHAKSHRVVVGDILYNLYHRKTIFSVILRATLDEAYEVIDTLLVELETNEKLREYYGDLYHPRKWGRKGFVTRWGQMVVAKSRGGKIRGIKYRQHRPDHLYLDDIDNDESVATKEQRDKTWRWATRAVIPSVAKDGTIAAVGTAIHEDCFVCRLEDNPVWDSKTYQAILRWPDRMDLWDRWAAIMREDGRAAATAFYREHQIALLVGAEVLWPERYGLLDLMVRRLEIGSTAFAQEYQNEPRDEETALFKAEWMHEYHLADVWGQMPLSVYTICDPATGKRRTGSKTAIVTIGVAGPRVYVLEAVHGDWTFRETLERLYEAWHRWHSMGVIIETIAYQTVLQEALQELAASRREALPIVPIDHQTVDKVARMQHLATYYENAIVRMLPEQQELRHELLFFRSEKDPIDLGDALEMGVRYAYHGGGQFEYQTSGVRHALAGLERY